MMNVLFISYVMLTLLLALGTGRCDEVVQSTSVLDQLITKVDTLVDLTTNLTHENERQNKENRNLATTVNRLVDTTNNLTRDNNKLKEENQNLTTTVTNLLHMTHSLRGANQQVDNELEQFKAANQQLTARLQLEVSHLKTKHHRSAFSAYSTVGAFRGVNGRRSTVPFNKVHYNLGGNYNSRSYVYTCPVNGVYFFIYTVYSAGLRVSGRESTMAEIVIDNKTINQAFCSTKTPEVIRCQVTNSVTSYCSRGSTVMVKTSGSEVLIYGSSSDHRTTFSGFLLYSN